MLSRIFNSMIPMSIHSRFPYKKSAVRQQDGAEKG